MRTLRNGMKGNDVLNLQLILNSNPETQMATTGDESPGHETGVYDYKTRIALIKFQKLNLTTPAQKNRLRREQGVAGLTTRIALESTAKKLVALGTLPQAGANFHAAAGSQRSIATGSTSSVKGVTTPRPSGPATGGGNGAGSNSGGGTTGGGGGGGNTGNGETPTSQVSSATFSSRVSSAASVITSRVLVPGFGFTGTTPQPATEGSGAGSDAKAIARWDVIPYQTFDTSMNVGVVAFHINDIEKVSFSVNNGPWKDVSSMTLNPETGIVEYWVTLRASDFADGQVEVRAIAYPTVGIPRVLQGPYQRIGEYSLLLNANSGHSLPQAAVYVSPAGSDTTGNGTTAKPYLTITKAANSANLSGTLDGVTIYLAEGDYAAVAGSRAATKQWLTITAAPGTNPDNVRIVSQGRTKTQLVRYLHVKMMTTSSTLQEGFTDGVNRIVWLDDVTVEGIDRYRSQRSILNNYVLMATDSRWYNVLNGPTSSTFLRNVDVKNVLSDAFQNGLLILNSSVDDINRGTTEAHPDFYQIFTTDVNMENVILYGVDGTNMDAQGIFIGGPPAGMRFQDMAFVNIYVEYRNLTPNLMSQWSGVTDHVVFKNSTIKQAWLWNAAAADVHNFLMQDTTIDSMSTRSPLTAQTVMDTVKFVRTTILKSGTFNALNGGIPTPPASSAASSIAPGSSVASSAASVAPASSAASSITSSVAAIVPSGIAGHWPLDGDATDTVSGNNGTLLNSPTFTSGHIGQALQLDGISQAVEVADASALNPSSNMTLSVWVNPSDLTSNTFRGIITKGCVQSSLANSQYTLTYYNSRFRFRVSDGATTQEISNTTAPQLNTWYHVVARFTGNSSMDFFVNGTKETTTATSLSSIVATTKKFGIGKDAGCNRYSWAGLLDDARIYNTALSDADITGLYQGTVSLHQKPGFFTALWQSLLANLLSWTH